ncbi:MAG TPA: hypothetical protein VE621_12860 [Bryobacteraceae bacterium]|nr:hypothetical protein [Bryobacteraceae bacterium]
MSSVIRRRQLPDAWPGVFMRAADPKLSSVDDVCEFRAGLRDFQGNPLDEFTRPLKKVCAVEFGLQGAEERVVLQPV